MDRKKQKHRALRRGLWAENLVCLGFWCVGYKILARRLETPMAEIDLLLRHRFVSSDQLVIVEVKFRQKMCDALEALHSRQHARLQRAALWLYASGYMKEKTSIRIDYVALSWDSLPRHLRDI